MIVGMTPLTVPRSRRKVAVKLVLGVIGSLVCLMITVILFQAVMSAASSPMAAIGLIFMLLATMLSVLSVVGLALLARKPGLVIEDRGLTDYTSAVSIGFIPWEQALGFVPQVYQAGRSRNMLVQVVFADPQWPWTQLRGWRLAFNRFNQLFIKMPGVISADTLSISHIELAALLVDQQRQRRPDLPPVAGPVAGQEPGSWDLSDPCGYLAEGGPGAGQLPR